MQNVIVHLIGKPGVGKLTIGREIAQMTGARLVDNHSINNVIFNLIAADGLTPLPEGTWPLVDRVRDVVYDTLVQLSPADMSFVFTNFMKGEDPVEYRYFLELVSVAEARASTFVPVILSCETAELVRRIVSPDRRESLKMIDPVAGARLNDEVPEFDTPHPNKLRLDVTHAAPRAAAETIINWVERCRPRQGS